MDRLGEDFELMALGTSLFEQVSSGSLARKEKDFALWQFTAGNNCGFDARHPGHDDVADEHIGLEALKRLDSLFTAEYRVRFKACLIQDDCQGVGDDLFIISDENPGFRCRRDCWICHADCPQDSSF